MKIKTARERTFGLRLAHGRGRVKMAERTDVNTRINCIIRLLSHLAAVMSLPVEACKRDAIDSDADDISCRLTQVIADQSQ